MANEGDAFECENTGNGVLCYTVHSIAYLGCIIEIDVKYGEVPVCDETFHIRMVVMVKELQFFVQNCETCEKVTT